MTVFHQNQIYTGTIAGYNSEGQGVLRVDGAVVFVPQTIQGETIDFRNIRQMRSAALGEVVAVHNPSPCRQTPDCPYYGQCGGCDFRHMSYDEELRAKRQRVQDALTRLGGANVTVESIAGAADPLRYRNKVQFPVGADGTVGFFQRRSHQVIPISSCPLQSVEADVIRNAVEYWMQRYHILPYDEQTGKGLLRHVCIRTNQAGESLCCLVINGKVVPHEPELAGCILAAASKTAGILLNTNTSKGNVVLGDRYRTLWGQDHLLDRLCDLTFRLSMSSFYQVNRAQAEVLYRTALDFASLTGKETVLDLYCGIGTITLCMAPHAKRVIGVETVSDAIRDAEYNAERNNIQNVEFICGDAAEVAQKLEIEGLHPDVITVDPPRKGLTEETVKVIASLSPERIVYVSCDPGTLSRDVRRLADWGYTALRAAAVDMFPRTRHVETVVLLSQQKPDDVIRVSLDLDEFDLTAAESKATYAELISYIESEYGLKVSNLYISQVKRKLGMNVGINYNLPKSDKHRIPQCPPEKEEAIVAALKHFNML